MGKCGPLLNRSGSLCKIISGLLATPQATIAVVLSQLLWVLGLHFIA